MKGGARSFVFYSCCCSRLLPSLIFEDQLPPYVFLGKEILQMPADSEEAEKVAGDIDKQLEVGNNEVFKSS